MSLIQTKVRVFAFNRATSAPVTGDAANITAKWAKDYGTPTALTDTNPTEAEDGFYYFDLSAGERDVSIIGEIFPESSTSGVQVIGVPAWFGAGGGGGAGLTGPWTRTITVTDSVSGDPIQNATVRFFRTGETETKATDVSGVASFTVEAATWSYAIVASGYVGVTGTVVVSASGDTGVVMVASPVFSASAPLCAVTLPIRDQYGQPLPATMVTLTFAGVTTGAAPAGIVMSPPPVQASDSSGIVQVNLIRLAKYTATYRIGTQTRQVSFTVPDAGTFVVTEV